MKQYRCMVRVADGCDTENWHDEGTGPHPFRKEGDGSISIDWRDKPAEDLRQQAMDRVGELDWGERVNYSGGGPVDLESELKRAVTDLYTQDAFGDTPAERAKFPMFDGLLAYFPDALAWVSRCSYEGGKQHNPGEPLHWAMDKSTDHENKILRHMMAGFTDDGDGVPHSVKVAWRALARAQEDLMRRYGAPVPPNARRTHPERGNPVNQRDED